VVSPDAILTWISLSATKFHMAILVKCQSAFEVFMSLLSKLPDFLYALCCGIKTRITKDGSQKVVLTVAAIFFVF
jgi:hypothetical protein